ncbi:hypothetical protein [Amycolatopsis magusensis]|uniref:hypothetical protein n=1 Tax=Amycolatopsis magusensis TaxID=882444 RepID=UPI0037A75676
MTTTDLVLHSTADLDTSPVLEPDTASALPTGLIAAAGALLGDDAQGIFSVMAGAFERMEWAEEEIAAAQARHPRHVDRIWHSFSLLVPNSGLERMSYERVYRSHCREILDRVAAGEDTRPGTAAEICCAMLSTSLLAPPTSAATGLYMRMYQAAGLPQFDELAESSRHHEALERSLIDDHERFARRQLTMDDRRLGDIDCHGRHHGMKTSCVYAAAGQLLLEA